MVLKNLLQEISGCTVCSPHLPLGCRPVLTAHKKSRIVIIGQAPGTVVHKTGIPWDDKSGDNLRKWMNIDKATFYNPENFAIIPMGFCYPGKGKSGDLPPRKECTPLWHQALLEQMSNVELTLLIGKYAQDYYLPQQKKSRLTDTVKNYKEYLPNYFVLPHPSPRNNIWQAKNEWFKIEVIPQLQFVVNSLIDS
jgi:uracil-DNA glycosylase